MEAFWQDLRYGVRILARNPAFTVVVVFTLALGIGANTAIFSVVNAYLLRPLPFEKPEELVHIWQTDSAVSEWGAELRVSVPNFVDWREQNTSFQQLGGYYYGSRNVTTAEEPLQVQIGYVTSSMISLLGVEPALGRTFLPEDGEPGRNQVVILSHGYWQRHFNADQDVLGQAVTLDGGRYEVIGVMPATFVFPLKATQMWTPLVLNPQEERRDTSGPLLVVGRLRPGGTTLEQGQAEMNAIARRLEEEYPESNKGRGARLVPLREALLFFYDEIRLMFFTLSLAVGFVLLIICANVGNLLLARATGRTREVAVRAALGASRLRLVRQFLTESLVLAFLGGAGGVVLAQWATSLLNPHLPEDLYRVGRLTLDTRVLWFSLGASLLSTLFFGLAPTLQLTGPNLTEALKEGDRGGHGGRHSRRLRSLLVVVEISLATVLLAGSGLMIQTFLRLQTVDPGFNPENVLTLELILPRSAYPTDAEQNVFYDEVLRRVESLPGVESAGAVYPLPLNFESLGVSFAIEGHERATSDERLSASKFWVTPGYFEAMQIPFLRGRAFGEQDNADGPGVVIVNRRLAGRFWFGADPIGAQVRLEPSTPDERLVRVVGVVGDSKHFLLNEEAAALLYVPQQQESTRRRFLSLRTVGDPLDQVSAVRSEIWAVDEKLPITAVRSMNQVLSESLAMWASPAALLGVLGVGALVLAAMGVYGVLAYSVSERAHEMGVRMALGAQSHDVVRLVLRQGALLVGAGIGVGLALAFALTHFLQSLLFGVGALDPLTFVGIPLLLAVVALLACYLPARRATKVDPMVVLRYE
jgi:putative ABC transport system permease protein